MPFSAIKPTSGYAPSVPIASDNAIDGASGLKHDSNLNPKALQGLLSHADIRTTQNLYVQVTDNLRDQARVAMEGIRDGIVSGEKNGEKAA